MLHEMTAATHHHRPPAAEMIGELDGAEMLALACGHDHTLTMLSMP